MPFIVYKLGDRFMLQSNTTGAYVGLIIAALPGESGRAFSYDFGTAYEPKELLNIQDFPELLEMPFFAIDYSGFDQIKRLLHDQSSPNIDTSIYNFVDGECKVNADHNNELKKNNDLVTLPIIWQYTPPNLKGAWKLPIWALSVNEQGCLMGNRDGLIISFNHEGEINYQHQLPQKIICFTLNEEHCYVGCNDGQIYELIGKIPRSVYHIRPNTYYSDLQIFSLIFAEDKLLLIDSYGSLSIFDQQFNLIRKNSDKLWRSWFLRCDDERIYIGHSKGVNCYAINKDKLLWQAPLNKSVLWGDLRKKFLIVGTTDGTIYQLKKQGDWKSKQTEIKLLSRCNSAVYCGVIHQEKKLIFAADHEGYIYSFNLQGKLLWQQRIKTGAILDLKYWQDRLYAVTTEGGILAINIGQLQ